ncbi:enoyl-CoA hydratase-related protein [Desertibacillus haloalkaliphilus]|uniref:enoyl-CoA hydratase-related protein n=1 Tax=Desertibacillus haloalkaliphilus TaxID=1328930 RepID=UPI001C272EB0|nr:enoyl-CoA hydratase-related protein [Desertibacillus haloalkaliphilus]MBU8906453.1 enoyl-CoA hydratase/isomerase family protein [Desertibacillus haloalkaliphilus]
MGKVECTIEQGLARVTINRPEALNCFDYETLTALDDIISDIHVNKEVRVVVITGAGEKAFSAGADLKERKTLNESQVRRNVKAIRDVFTAIENLPQPTIAAINGYALGGGFELALACDFRIAATEAQMGLTELSWAIIPGAGGTQRLPRLIGQAKAMELILMAKKIPASEALELGILNRVVERDNLMLECEEFAGKMLENGPLALQQAKYAIRHSGDVDIHTGLAMEAKAYEVIIPTKDRIEALEAFAEKRKPNFKGE